MGDQYIKELEAALKMTLDKYREEIKAMRSNRPSVELVENIKVPAYGNEMPIIQLAALSVVPPREIDVRAWDKQMVGPIMKAIQDAKIGLSVSNEGDLIRTFLPTLTDERREELSKTIKKMTEGYRIQIRTKREEIIKKVKNAEDVKELNEDQVFKTKEKIQKTVDEANKQVEQLLEKKLEEIKE